MEAPIPSIVLCFVLIMTFPNSVNGGSPKGSPFKPIEFDWIKLLEHTGFILFVFLFFVMFVICWYVKCCYEPSRLEPPIIETDEKSVYDRTSMMTSTRVVTGISSFFQSRHMKLISKCIKKQIGSIPKKQHWSLITSAK
ncbi:unnamed protein product [Ceutorhynchus assimilis]|uniref:ATP synthase F0 subunit 8 n=1 Tax=Ceutorhynchus assimilis TaxID=467358 RepID=A0A9N9MGM9_9CUCU|nr:unnamed protein product [Ceutorhynchus assimilis]